jgi:hypothetical protein
LNTGKGQIVERKYRLNEPLIAVQVIEGEAILISFETGSYYSARGEGAEIVDLLRSPRTVSEISAAMAEEATEGSTDLSGRVVGFLNRLLDEGLAVGSVDDADTSADQTSHQVTGYAFDVDRADVPHLEKFTDLEDLLLLDPIHDADEAGWPIARPD